MRRSVLGRYPPKCKWGDRNADEIAVHGSMVPSTCRYMRGTACKVGSDLQKKSLFYGYTDYQKGGKKGVLPAFQQDLAAFMLIRGPYAWLGYSWMGCTWPLGR